MESNAGGGEQMVLDIGDPVGEMTFLQADNVPLQLSALKVPTLVLIMLRHLA
jgi:hypothetical protein